MKQTRSLPFSDGLTNRQDRKQTNMQNEVRNIVNSINRRKLTNNTQKVLYSLLSAGGEWVPRTNLRTPSASARARDLRKPQFGMFGVQCATANQLSRKTRTAYQTFYRLDPNSVTPAKLVKAFEGVIDNSRNK